VSNNFREDFQIYSERKN